MNAGIIFLIVLVVCGAGVTFYQQRSKIIPHKDEEPAGLHLGPIINGENHTSGAVFGSAGSALGGFSFPQPDWAAGNVHYLTKRPTTKPRLGRMRARFTITAEDYVRFINDYGSAATVSLYFQRRGDNWSSEGKYEAYRWYGATIPLAIGTYTLESDGKWGAVNTSHNDDNLPAFLAALKGVGRFGLVFGGGSGQGHGACATGPAEFILHELTFE